MRDLESIQATLTIAETGHLVFATLHTNDTAQAIDRIVDVFPAERPTRRSSLQLAVHAASAIVFQRLLPSIDRSQAGRGLRGAGGHQRRAQPRARGPQPPAAQRRSPPARPRACRRSSMALNAPRAPRAWSTTTWRRPPASTRRRSPASVTLRLTWRGRTPPSRTRAPVPPAGRRRAVPGRLAGRHREAPRHLAAARAGARGDADVPRRPRLPAVVRRSSRSTSPIGLPAKPDSRAAPATRRLAQCSAGHGRAAIVSAPCRAALAGRRPTRRRGGSTGAS